MKIQSRLFWLVFLLLATTQLSALAQTDVTNLVEQGVVKFDSGDLDGALADYDKPNASTASSQRRVKSLQCRTSQNTLHFIIFPSTFGA